MGKAWVDNPWDTGSGSHSRVSTLSPSLTYEIVPIQGQKQPSHPPSLHTHLSPRSYLRSHPHHIGKQEGALTQGYPPLRPQVLLGDNQPATSKREGREKSPLVGRPGPGGAETSVPPGGETMPGRTDSLVLGSIRAGPLGVPVPLEGKAVATNPAAHALTRFSRPPSREPQFSLSDCPASPNMWFTL